MDCTGGVPTPIRESSCTINIAALEKTCKFIVRAHWNSFLNSPVQVAAHLVRTIFRPHSLTSGQPT